ncbi:11-oxo-beta-amyrin 30-oxidase [Quercus suber]|uniref:11-oxo-beta-amyrin 30-oxidase n=1 Tax=Quercus suber TaxID=58331 RepID=A0AAW0KHV4_QUESU
MSPEQIKGVFTKIGDFQKPKPNPLVRLLAMGVVNYEGEKWAKYRNIINLAFHKEKLKACIENVRASLDDGAVKVLKAKLAATSGLETKVKTEKSGRVRLLVRNSSWGNSYN